VEIRRLENGDLDDLLVLYSHLHASDEPPPERASVESIWQKLLSDSSYRYYGGFVGDELVSSCTLTVVPNLTRGCRPYGLIENVVTHADHRRRGYGRAILQHALADAWESDCYKVMLLTGRLDEGTFRFYESAGFSRQGKQAFIARPGR
jgi:GNAT superfamily N-acetyltransferase